MQGQWTDGRYRRAEERGSAGASIRTTALLELEGISKGFPGVKALQDVHFSTKAGEIHALVGENGAGKSTASLIGAYAESASAPSRPR